MVDRWQRWRLLILLFLFLFLFLFRFRFLFHFEDGHGGRLMYIISRPVTILVEGFGGLRARGSTSSTRESNVLKTNPALGQRQLVLPRLAPGFVFVSRIGIGTSDMR